MSESKLENAFYIDALLDENKELKRKLEIAKEALRDFEKNNYRNDCNCSARSFSILDDLGEYENSSKG